jgi:hypothetical protein
MLAQRAQKVTETFYGATSASLAIQDGEDAGQTIKQVDSSIQFSL